MLVKMEPLRVKQKCVELILLLRGTWDGPDDNK